LGSPRRGPPGLFPNRASLYSSTVPEYQGIRFILRWRLASPEFLRLQTRSSPFGVELYLPWSFVPLRDIESSVHSMRRFPRLRYVPSSGFHSLSTACSASSFTGLFHPANHVQGSLVRGLLPPHSRPPSSGGATPMPLSDVTLEIRRSLPGSTRLDCEALLRVKMRSSGSLFRLALGRSLHRVPPPPGPARPRRELRFLEAIRSCGLTISAFTLASSLHFSVLSARGWVDASPSLPTCSRFQPSV